MGLAWKLRRLAQVAWKFRRLDQVSWSMQRRWDSIIDLRVGLQMAALGLLIAAVVVA
jgi:hypothetical protein